MDALREESGVRRSIFIPEGMEAGDGNGRGCRPLPSRLPPLGSAGRVSGRVQTPGWRVNNLEKFLSPPLTPPSPPLKHEGGKMQLGKFVERK